ncbi:N-acetyltransferase [Nonomuraea glycinis]|uniref:N-acetyltransferase n=2 Tax=Nonomuraea glycinis TaxID=2047744 RepID=A0A918E8P0_9ACTN|nr:N-acetyltransferase [Nonomuraea glycinis]
MLVRDARPDEAELLSELAFRSKAYWGYDERFMATCREELTLSASQVEAQRTMVADQDGRALGFVTVEGEPPEGELGMLFVEPDAIGQGIGRLLFEHAVTAARGLGFARLVIEADPHAEPFYLAMGATRIGMTPSGSIPGRSLPLLGVTVSEHVIPAPARPPCDARS